MLLISTLDRGEWSFARTGSSNPAVRSAGTLKFEFAGLGEGVGLIPVPVWVLRRR
jgi:hypothetical protein